MTISQTAQYLRTKKKILKKHSLSENDIDMTITLFENNPEDISLHYKRMNCKKDKDRYSIRILNTQYRVLMTVQKDDVFLVCICSHDDYDRRNKDC